MSECKYMNIKLMKKKDFKKIPKWKHTTDLGLNDVNSIVIIPTKKMHNSGFMYMDFVAVADNLRPLYRLSGYSDVLEIDCSTELRNCLKDILNAKIPRRWKIDCLPCGYLRLFAVTG